jgi:streptomycin 6-kinase
MTTLKIRKATLEDLPELNRVLRSSKGHWGYTEEYLNEFMEKLRVTENRIRNYHNFCVYVDDQYVGFYAFRKIDEHKDELDFFFLDSPYIGKGFGRLMWDSCLDTATKLGIKDFVLNAEPNSEAFYLKLGCKKIDSKASVLSSETRQIPILFYSIE